MNQLTFRVGADTLKATESLDKLCKKVKEFKDHERPITLLICDECKKTFKGKKDLKRHKKDKHK